MQKLLRIIAGLVLLSILYGLSLYIVYQQHTHQVQQEVINTCHCKYQRLQEDWTLKLLMITQQQQELDTVQTDLQLTKTTLTETQQELNYAYQLLTSPFEATWSVHSAIATAYSPFDNRNGIQAEGDGSLTSTGVRPGPKIFAVDPKRIPYGSQMILIYGDGTTIQGIAGDTGGILRNADEIIVDVYKDTFEEAMNHGRQEITLIWKAKDVDDK